MDTATKTGTDASKTASKRVVQKEIKVLRLKIMHHLSTLFQNSVVYKLTMQKI